MRYINIHIKTDNLTRHTTDMKINILLTAALMGLPVCAVAQGLEVAPGTLGELLTPEIKGQTSLTLTGEMDLRDFTALGEQMPQLQSLDLSGVRVVGWESREPVRSGAARHDADVMPPHALLGLKLTELKLPATTTSLEEGSLAGQAFTTLELPSTLTNIGDNALYGCTALKTLTMPAGLKTIGSYALGGCTSLESADLSATGVTTLEARTFAGDASLASISLPSTLRHLGEGCLASTPALKAVSLPSTLTEVGVNAFAGSGIETLTLPATVSLVGDFAFSRCEGLASVVLLNPEAELGRGLFMADPAFVTFTAPGLEAFPDYLFAATPTADVAGHIGTVKRVGDYALKGNSAKTLRLGSSLVYLGNGAMEGMDALTNIDATALGARVPTLGKDVFAGVDQSAATLLVAKDTPQAWQEADQWREFKILEDKTEGVDNVAGETDNRVTARWQGTLLILTAQVSMDAVQVYDASGAAVASLTPAATQVAVEGCDWAARVYVVRVSLRSGHVATLKLMR